VLTGPALLLVLAAGPVKLAAPGFACEGAGEKLCAAYLERFSTLLGGAAVKVTTASDVASVLGLERQKQLLGCSESGCLAELAGALGVDGLLTGSLVKTSAGWLATLKVVRTRDGATWVQATARPRTEEELQGFLDRTAGEFRAQLPSGAPGLPGVVAAPAGPSPLVPWIPAIAGGAVLLGGVGLFVASKVDAGSLKDVGTLLPPEQVRAVASRGAVEQTLGLVLGGVGLAAIAASLTWVQAGGQLQAGLVPVPGGGAVVVGGGW